MIPSQSMSRALRRRIAIAAVPVAVCVAALGLAASAEAQPPRAALTAGLAQRALQRGRVRVIVGLRMPVAPEGLLTIAEREQQRHQIAAAQSSLMRELAGHDLGHVKAFRVIPNLALEVDSTTLQFLAGHPAVAYVEEDRQLNVTLAESTPLIGATTAWSRGYRGSGETIAILDTGVESGHPFLAGRVVSEACYSTTSAAYGTTALCADASTAPGSGAPCTISSSCDHGTHVAGIAAGSGASFSGVAPDANLIAVQVFSGVNGGGISAFTSDIDLGLQHVYDLRNAYNIAAVNLSLGTDQTYGGACDATDQSTASVISQLRSVGIATVVASGNNSSAVGLSSPACISSAISVGSTRDGSFGTTADTISDFSNSASFLSLLAPGEWITSSVPGGGAPTFDTFRGTSMAAPHVAGALALLKSRNPTLSVSQLLDALSSTGPNITDPRNLVTKRRIDVDAALSAIPPYCGYSINPTAITITWPAASGTILVSAPAGCGWTAASDSGFISIDSSSSGTGSAAIAFTVAANTSPSARTGTATIAGQTFTVTQQGAPLPCTYSIDVPSASVSAAGGSGAVTVTASAPSCQWDATSVSPFLTFTNGLGRSGSGSVTYNVAASFSTRQRIGNATIAGRAFSVAEIGTPVDMGVLMRETQRADFNLDTFSDLVWQDSVSGARAVWYLQGGTTTRTPAYLNPAVVDLDWQIVGTGDFNGDGKPDLVWWNRVSGTLYLWYMDGLNRVGDGYFSLRGISDTRWKVAGIGDFNGDGHPDILWQHDTYGWLGVWEFNDRTFLAGIDLTPNQVDVPWKVVGVADFNGDGGPDLLWRNMANGQLGVWVMNGTVRQSFVPLTPQLVDDLSWQIAAVIDIDGDQTPDIVWRHVTQGWVAVWYMNGTTRTDARSFPFIVDTTWKIAGPR